MAEAFDSIRSTVPSYSPISVSRIGTSEKPIRSSPGPQVPHPEIRKVAVHLIVNKTGQAGLEDALMLRVRDEFLRDGRYPLVPESEADGVVWIEKK